MEIKTLNLSSHSPFRNPNNRRFYPCSSSAIVAHFPHYLPLPQLSHISSILTSSSFRANQRFRISCITPIDQNLIETPNDLTEEDSIVSTSSQVEVESDPSQGIISSVKEGINVEIVNDSIWMQIKEIALFAGPAAGLWLCGPLMSLIDTAIIGQGSSLELAALGPATVVCDYLSYVFMFLSIATSNMVATSLATGDKNDVQHKISILLFVGFACGLGMLLLTKFLGIKLLSGFTGAQNLHLVPAANTYVQIRGLAWPAILVGWVTQSASLGMKDSWGPLKALAVASIVNATGDIVLCMFLGYGIAGAAWATMVSQVVAAFMMIGALKNKGYNAFSIAIPSAKELLQIFELAAPVFVTMISKVAFYSFLAYFATSMGTRKIAAHQVMIQVYCMCTVWGEPLSQTAQSFMPELICGINKSLQKARMLLKSLLVIGAIAGAILGVVGTSVPWLFPNLFTTDAEVIGEMHKVLLPYLIALIVTPSTHSLEGTLLAGRDLRFLSISMSGCFTLGGLLVLLVSNRGFGLAGCWWSLAAFQWARFFLALSRLTSPTSFLQSDKLILSQVEKVKTT
ncbi:protein DETOXIFICATION 46, chloroplastic-like [Papaver somniferum]|uniref:protein DETOXIFICATION 46, chloroplastic-like n=1 Tax=Papaver somniferum TaxID=3469 RepID=UPI000E6F597A|nr:protein DETOXIFICATION 46, chloroplastic-like [Papaver somniferum]